MRNKFLLFMGLILILSACSSPATSTGSKHKTVLGTYASPPMKNSRVDIPELISQLKDLNANTYNFLIWKSEKDWDDLQLFLPVAKKNKINVWVSLVPPTESQPKAKWNSEPFKMDYEKWATEIGKLSKRYPNLVAWSIDDFAHNLTTYTSEYLQRMINNARAVNPKIKFIPCLYYRQVNKNFAEKYGSLIDGVLFPYRAESKGANLRDATVVKDEIENLRKLFRPGMQILLDVYSTAHSRLGASTPEYVRDVVQEGMKYADGVLIYTHPSPDKETAKYNYIKTEFNK